MVTSASERDLLAKWPTGETLALKSLAFFSSHSDLEAGTFHITHALSRKSEDGDEAGDEDKAEDEDEVEVEDEDEDEDETKHGKQFGTRYTWYTKPSTRSPGPWETVCLAHSTW